MQVDSEKALEDLPVGRERSGEPFVGRVSQGPVVVVQRLSLTRQEEEEFQDIDEHRAPLPGWGAYVAVAMNGRRHATVVKDIVPRWEPYSPANDPADFRNSPSSPSRGIAVAWDGGIASGWEWAPGTTVPPAASGVATIWVRPGRGTCVSGA